MRPTKKKRHLSPKGVPESEVIRKGARTVLELLDDDEDELARELRAYERGADTGAGAAWLGRKHRVP